MQTTFLYVYPFLLVVFVALTLPIADAGHRSGSRGATTAAFTMWIVLALVQPLLLPLGHYFPSAFLIIGPIVAAVSLAIIFIPMVSLSRCSWTRGRMAAGLVGAAVMALVYPFLVLFFFSTLGPRL